MGGSPEMGYAGGAVEDHALRTGLNLRAGGHRAGLMLGDVMRWDLGLRLRVGPDDHEVRPVAGAHAIETADAPRWLEPDWILLTDGLRLTSGARQRELVDSAADRGLCAIGLAVGVRHAAVPRAMAERAQQVGLPLFEVDAQAALRDIVRLVGQAVLDEDVRLLQRIRAGEQRLYAALHDPRPREAVADRLLALVGAQAVAVATGDGSVEYAAGHPATPGRLDLSAVASGRDVQEVHFHLLPVGPRAAAGALLVEWGPDGPQGRAGRDLARCAAALLAALGASEVSARERAQRDRRDLVAQILDDEPAPGAATRLERLGWGHLDEADVLVASTLSPTPPETLESFLRQHGSAAVCLARADRLVVVATPREDWPEIALLARDSLKVRHLGVGARIGDLAQLARSVKDAEVAIRQLGAAQAPAGATLRADDLRLAGWLVASGDPDAVRRRARDLLGPLHHHEDLLHTLTTWFALGLDVGAAAEALFVHPNTVRYRLRRAEGELQRPLSDVGLLAELHLALLAVGGDAAAPAVPAPRAEAS